MTTRIPSSQSTVPPEKHLAFERVSNALWLLAALAALGAVFFICLKPIAITDFWWQAKTGELIVRTGEIPRRDPFSWTAHGQPWLVHEWLTEVFFYFAYSSGQEWLLVGYKCGLAALACGLVLTRSWLRSGSIGLGIAAALGTAYALRNYADLRPQMLTFVLLAGLLLALDEYREGRLARLPWAIPVLFALWANLHGGVVVGLALITLWVAGEAAGRWLFREPSHGLPALAASVAVSAAAVAVNPNGFGVYTYPFQVLGHPEVMDYITEWFSPNFHNRVMLPFEILLLGTFGLLAFTRSRRFGEILVLVAMAHAALLSQRNTVPFALAAAPAFAAAARALWDELPFETLRSRARLPAVRVAAASLAAAAAIGLLGRSIPRAAPGNWFEYGSRIGFFPRNAVRLLAQGAWPGRIYNDYVWGGYLIWHLPHRPVFVDGRAEVYYPTRAFEDEMHIHRVLDDWQKVLDRRGVEVILTSRWSDLARALQREPGWKLAFTGPVEVVFTRAPENRRG